MAEPRPGADGPAEPLPQAWVPRVVNLTLALVLLLFLVPLFRHFSSRATSVQVVLVIVGLPFVLLTLACLASAVRPGSLGRLTRRLRHHPG